MRHYGTPAVIYRLCTIMLLLCTLWFLGFTQFIRYIPRYVLDKASTAEAAVVLTGGSQRLEQALSLLEKGTVSRLFISGVGEGVTLENILTHTETTPEKANQLTQHIDLGYTAKDTRGNAQETAQWVQKNNITSLRLVTAHYHIRRSLLELETLLPETNIIPHPVFPENIFLTRWWTHKGTFFLLTKEYNKYLWSLSRLTFD